MRPNLHRLINLFVIGFTIAWIGTSEAQLLPITTRVITINNLAVAALRHPTDPGSKSQHRNFHHAS